MAEARRIPELEGLRAVLAWTVAFVHMAICVGFLGPSIHGRNLLFELAESAVDAFMLLSGFAITRLRLTAREPLSRYFTRRAFRILPAYWVALGVSILLLPTLIANLHHLRATPLLTPLIELTKVGADRFWPDLITHIFLVHGVVPQAVLPFVPFTLLGVAWTLSLEEQFYVVAPFVVRFALKNSVARWTLFGLTIVACLYYVPIAATFSNAFLPANAAFFVAGSLSHFALSGERSSARVLKFVILPCGLTILLRAIGAHTVLESWLPALTWATVIGAISLDRLPRSRTLLSSALMQTLGRISYSTYLFHMIVITIVQAVIWRASPAIGRRTLLVTTFTFSTIGTAVVSYLAWGWIERPFQRLGRGKSLVG